MVDKEINDIFKDFKYGDSEPKKTEIKKEKKKISFDDNKPNFEFKYRANKPDFNPDKKKKPKSLERIVFILVIIGLMGFIFFDKFMDNDSPTAMVISSPQNPACETQENFIEKNNASLESETFSESLNSSGNDNSLTEDVSKGDKKENEEADLAALPDKTSLTGKLEIKIDRIYSETGDDNNGEIGKISFTIYNGLDDFIFPVVNAYVYDSSLDRRWETKSRGEFKFDAGIPSGEHLSGSISLSPKKFYDLDLVRNIRLSLNDTKSGLFTSVNREYTII